METPEACPLNPFFLFSQLSPLVSIDRVRQTCENKKGRVWSRNIIFLRALENSKHFSISGEELTLYNADDRLILLFKSVYLQ